MQSKRKLLQKLTEKLPEGEKLGEEWIQVTQKLGYFKRTGPSLKKYQTRVYFKIPHTNREDAKMFGCC
jgi:hypothetical protein